MANYRTIALPMFFILGLLAMQACVREIPPVVLDYPPALFEQRDSVHLEARLTRHMSGRVEHLWFEYQDTTGTWIKHGPEVEYFLSGIKKTVQYWRKGKLDGPVTYWSEEGGIQGFAVYRAGQLNGPAKAWNKDGKIKSVKYWKAGKLNGLQREYDDEGKLVKQRWWKDNVPVANPDSMLIRDTVATDTTKPITALDTLPRPAADTGLPPPKPQLVPAQ